MLQLNLGRGENIIIQILVFLGLTPTLGFDQVKSLVLPFCLTLPVCFLKRNKPLDK